MVMDDGAGENYGRAAGEDRGAQAVELTQLLREQQSDATKAMMTHCTERFERRLTKEISLLRVTIGDGFTGIRREMSTDRVEMLNEVSTGRVGPCRCFSRQMFFADSASFALIVVTRASACR